MLMQRPKRTCKQLMMLMLKTLMMLVLVLKLTMIGMW
jgi:hypothetical protein